MRGTLGPDLVLFHTMNSPSKMQLSGLIWQAATAFMTWYDDCTPCSLLFLLQ